MIQRIIGKYVLEGVKFLDSSTSIRTISKLNSVEKLKVEVANRKKFVKKLQDLLKIKPLAAIEVLHKYRKFSDIDGNSLGQNYNLCLEAGMSLETLSANPEILAQSKVSEKITKLKDLPYDINFWARLLTLEMNKIAVFARQEKGVKRLEFISELFEVDKSKVIEWICQKPFLATLDLNHIKESVKLLEEYDIPKDEIINDLWVLKYSTNTIKNRLKIAKESNVQVFKTWMVRVPQDIFDKHVQRLSDKKLILGDHSLVEYLSGRLDCSEDVAKYIVSKQSALKNKSVKRMDEMIDFLLGQGFEKLQICRAPKILLHSADTVKKRLKEVEDRGGKFDTLHIYTKSLKQFNQHLENLQSNKKKTKTQLDNVKMA